VRIHPKDDEIVVSWVCECCDDAIENAGGGIFTLDAWNASSRKVVVYDIVVHCPNCGNVVVNSVLRQFYAMIGQKLGAFLRTNDGCALWGMTDLLKQFSEYIVDSEFVLIDKKPPFRAKDWELFEETLGDRKVMTKILSEHPVFASLPRDQEIGTVIVLTAAHYEAIKTEVHSTNPEIKVIRYTDVLYE
jgi:hypothetical protein